MKGSPNDLKVGLSESRLPVLAGYQKEVDHSCGRLEVG